MIFLLIPALWLYEISRCAKFYVLTVFNPARFAIK
jgi:hypothetical protein